MNRVLKKSFKIFGIGVLALLVVLAAAIALISSQRGEMFIAKKVVSVLDHAFSGKLSFSRMQISPAQIVLFNVELRDPEDRRVFFSPRVEASFAIGPLIRKKLSLDEVVVDRPGRYR